jgi:hypothetical protein
MSDRNVTEDDVREEHVTAVNQPAHWAYLFGVLVGGTALMIAFIAALGAAGS